MQHYYINWFRSGAGEEGMSPCSGYRDQAERGGAKRDVGERKFVREVWGLTDMTIFPHH